MEGTIRPLFRLEARLRLWLWLSQPWSGFRPPPRFSYQLKAVHTIASGKLLRARNLFGHALRWLGSSCVYLITERVQGFDSSPGSGGVREILNESGSEGLRLEGLGSCICVGILVSLAVDKGGVVCLLGVRLEFLMEGPPE